MTGRNMQIELMMQIPGHARCRVDGGFGHIKQRYRRTDVDCIDQMEDVVNSSAHTNEAVRFPAWQWRDWKQFLGPRIRPIKGIRYELKYIKQCSSDENAHIHFYLYL